MANDHDSTAEAAALWQTLAPLIATDGVDDAQIEAVLAAALDRVRSRHAEAVDQVALSAATILCNVLDPQEGTPLERCYDAHACAKDQYAVIAALRDGRDVETLRTLGGFSSGEHPEAWYDERKRVRAQWGLDAPRPTERFESAEDERDYWRARCANSEDLNRGACDDLNAVIDALAVAGVETADEGHVRSPAERVAALANERDALRLAVTNALALAGAERATDAVVALATDLANAHAERDAATARLATTTAALRELHEAVSPVVLRCGVSMSPEDHRLWHAANDAARLLHAPDANGGPRE